VYNSTALHRSKKNMEKYVEQYHAWGGQLTLPLWTDVQGWKKGSFSITEAPGTPLPAWFRKILHSKTNLADLEKIPLVGG
jgi:hypothetical protein